MIGQDLHVVMIGYAKKALQSGTRDRERMKLYATAVKELHIIVFTKKDEGFPDFQQEGNIYLYATNSRFNWQKIFNAINIGKKILKSNKKSG